MEQVKAVVVIESVDVRDQIVVYRMEDGMKARRYVEKRELLQGLRPGDRVEVTLTRERAISIERPRP
jgi:hypothetical protein